MENERIEKQTKVSKRKQNPMLVSFDDVDSKDKWNECRIALSKEYKLSIQDACCLLKCNRSWVHQYIRPHVHYIYLQSHYADMARKKENVWLNEPEFRTLIKSNIECTRKTIAVPMECLLETDAITEYHIMFEETARAKANWDMDEYKKLRKEMKDYINGHLTEIGQAVYAEGKRPDRTRRTATTATPAEMPRFSIDQLIAVHDVLTYGESTEVKYREFFDKGVYKMVLTLPNADGVIGERIYYLEPPKGETDHLYDGKSFQYVPIAYADYLEYFGGTERSKS